MRSLVLGDHEFACIDEMPAGVMLDLAESSGEAGSTPVAQMTPEQRTRAGAASMARVRVLRRVVFTLVVDDEHERLDAWLHDPRGPSLEVLMDAIGTLVQGYTDRPTERPSASPPGADAPGPSSRVVSFSRGTVEVVGPSSPGGPPHAS